MKPSKKAPAGPAPAGQKTAPAKPGTIKGKRPQSPKRRHAGHSGDWKPRFLAAYAKRPIIEHACRAARIHSDTFYEHRKKDPEFANAVKAAGQLAGDRLEEEAWRRAVEGTKHGVWKEVAGKPKKVEVVTEYSDALLIFLLKARDPVRFRENGHLILSGHNDGPVQVQVGLDTTFASALDKVFGVPQAPAPEPEKKGDAP